jgi:outer membrane lipoprotein-sorting protein
MNRTTIALLLALALPAAAQAPAPTTPAPTTAPTPPAAPPAPAPGTAPAPTPTPARSEPEALQMLKRYDAIMGPEHFEGEFAMVAHRADGSSRTYEMRTWKSGMDKFRAFFTAPAPAKGQEILRVGDNFWVYMPNLKKSVRLAARESFMGGDFNNADVLRVNYTTDYDATVQKETTEGWVLELKAKTPASSYDRIVLTVAKEDGMPMEAHFFAASGKELRAAEFKEPKSFRGHKRPSKITMKNMIEPARWSEMVVRDFKVVKGFPATKFVLTELGK